MNEHLLKELHILTKDGALNQDSRRKLKQVEHLIQLITPHLEGLKSLADLGAGKSYLGFMLYDAWIQKHKDMHLWIIERNEKLIDKCKEIAQAANFDRCSFASASIEEAISDPKVPENVDAVTALHACDTATDEAIHFALKKNAKFIALVPCCQAEVAKLLADLKTSEKVHQLWRHNIHRREFGSHLTNVIRSLYLESKGYKVRVTELVGWEHSMKNELIVAEKIQHSNKLAQKELDKILEAFPLKMKLLSE